MRFMLVLAVISCIVAVARAGDADRETFNYNSMIKAVNSVASAVKRQSKQCSCETYDLKLEAMGQRINSLEDMLKMLEVAEEPAEEAAEEIVEIEADVKTTTTTQAPEDNVEEVENP